MAAKKTTVAKAAKPAKVPAKKGGAASGVGRLQKAAAASKKVKK